MQEIAPIRKFGGRQYIRRAKTVHSTKRAANNAANQSRKDGWLARVVKVKTGYVVYESLLGKYTGGWQRHSLHPTRKKAEAAAKKLRTSVRVVKVAKSTSLSDKIKKYAVSTRTKHG